MTYKCRFAEDTFAPAGRHDDKSKRSNASTHEPAVPSTAECAHPLAYVAYDVSGVRCRMFVSWRTGHEAVMLAAGISQSISRCGFDAVSREEIHTWSSQLDTASPTCERKTTPWLLDGVLCQLRTASRPAVVNGTVFTPVV